MYGAYLPWKERPGRFRSLGDGQVDFTQVFSRLTAGGYKSWAVIEWECVYKRWHAGRAELLTGGGNARQPQPARA